MGKIVYLVEPFKAVKKKICDYDRRNELKYMEFDLTFSLPDEKLNPFAELAKACKKGIISASEYENTINDVRTYDDAVHEIDLNRDEDIMIIQRSPDFDLILGTETNLFRYAKGHEYRTFFSPVFRERNYDEVKHTLSTRDANEFEEFMLRRFDNDGKAVKGSEFILIGEGIKKIVDKSISRFYHLWPENPARIVLDYTVINPEDRSIKGLRDAHDALDMAFSKDADGRVKAELSDIKPDSLEIVEHI